MCFFQKCNWCNKNDKDLMIIKKYCKWYNFYYHYICFECYNNKINFEPTKRPISKPYFLDCMF